MHAHVVTLKGERRIVDLLIPVRLNDEVSNLIQTWTLSDFEGYTAAGPGDTPVFETVIGWGPGHVNDKLLEKKVNSLSIISRGKDAMKKEATTYIRTPVR